MLTWRKNYMIRLFQKTLVLALAMRSLGLQPYFTGQQWRRRLQGLTSSGGMLPWGYFMNTKMTASMMHTKAARWFHCRVSPRKQMVVKRVKTVRVMTS